MTREMDNMDLDAKKRDIMAKLPIRIDRKPQMAFWGVAIAILEREGKVVATMVDVDDQYSYLSVVAAE